MTRAPKIKCDLSCRLHRLWPRSPAQIQEPTARKSPGAMEHDANWPKDRKTQAEFASMSHETSARAGRAKAIFLVKSP